MNEYEKPINLYQYRSLCADFIDMYHNELTDMGRGDDITALTALINTIRTTNFSRCSNIDDVIKWHKDLLGKFPIYSDFVSRGWMFIVAHLKAMNDFDAMAKLSTALSSAVALSFVPQEIDLYRQVKVLTAEEWLKNLVPSSPNRFMNFILLIQLTALNPSVEDANPPLNGTAGGAS